MARINEDKKMFSKEVAKNRLSWFELLTELATGTLLAYKTITACTEEKNMTVMWHLWSQFKQTPKRLHGYLERFAQFWENQRTAIHFHTCTAWYCMLLTPTHTCIKVTHTHTRWKTDCVLSLHRQDNTKRTDWLSIVPLVWL